MPSLNGFKDRIQSVAKVLATAALSASIPGGAALFNPALRKKITNDLSNAQATKAVEYLKELKNETTVEPAVDHTEKATRDFYKTLGKYDTAVDQVMSVEAELQILADEYQQKSEAKASDDLVQKITDQYESLETAQLNNMKEAESAAKQLESATNKLSGALNAMEKLIDNKLSSKLSGDEVKGMYNVSKNFNGLRSTLSLDLARGSSAKQMVEGLKSSSSIKLGISAITGNKASKKKEEEKKNPEDDASEKIEKGNRARKNLAMKLRPKGA